MGLNLAATITLDGAQFERGMRRVGESVSESIKGFVIGAVGIGTIEQAFARTIETADELVNTSKRLGIGVEQLQVLKQAAMDNNVEFSALAATFEKIDIARAKALGGGADAGKFLRDFKALGVSKDQLLTQSAAALFQGPLSQTAQSVNPEQIAAQLRDVLGRSFGPEIAVLTTNFQELGAKMKSFGAIMDSTTAVQLKTFKDEMNLIGQILTSEFAPIIVGFGKAMLYITALLGTIGTALGNFLTDFAGFAKGGVAMNWDSLKTAADYWKSKTGEIDSLDARAKEIANALDHPKPPDLRGEAGAMKEHRERERIIGEDALTKVGNFLGTSRGAINGAQQQLVIHAATTARSDDADGQQYIDAA